MVGPVSQSGQLGAPDHPTPAPNSSLPPTEPRPRAASWARRLALIAAGALVVLIALVATGTVIEQYAYAGRVLPGVDVDGVDSAGYHEVTVYDSVARLGVTLSQSPVRVRIGKQVLTAAPSLLDLSVDARATAFAAASDGRHGNPFARIAGTALRRFRPDRVRLRVIYDENRLEGLLDGWSARTDNGAVEGGLRFEGTKVVPIEPRTGTGIVRSRARAALQRMLDSPQRPVVDLPVGTLHPRVDSAAVAAAAVSARRLLRTNVVIVSGHNLVIVRPREIARALGTRVVNHALAVTIDSVRLHALLAPQLVRFESPAVDASFAVTDQNTIRVVSSRDGRGIDMPAVTRAILRGETRIVAPLLAVKPHRNTAWARKLGIVQQVGSFTTNYPAGETRVTNIHRGADLLNNTVVEPGQTFSLNRTVGPRTAARGFVTAPVFAQGEFFDDYGGGVSQLATTTYNAAFFAGLADVTHQPHTIYISRYPPGREATVNYGVIDLQFRNDSPHGILIRTYYSSTSITVSLYGDTDGRTAQEQNHTTSNPVPVADQLIQCPASPTVDPHNLCATLPAGQTEQISTGDAGFDVALDRVIDQPGKAERREHYTWHYTMLPNQILVGGGSGATTPESSTTGPAQGLPPGSSTGPPTT
jgi:vancomycin resistance protein YoaR